MSLMIIRSRIQEYNVHFASSGDFLASIGKKFFFPFFVVDAKVWQLYRDSSLSCLVKHKVKILPVGEEKKTLKTVSELYDYLIGLSARRNDALVSIGGGIVQDITGFAASTLYRGIKWIFLPTTLLAQADSCIGGKTSLNYKGFKNLIGTFYPPKQIFIDINFIATQKKPDFYSGVGEIVKLHIAGGPVYVKRITKKLPGILARDKQALASAIGDCLYIKQGYIEKDEFDTGKRNLLNYGHCFGHALESASFFRIPHGQAVVVGMALANILSRKRKLLSSGSEEFVFQNLILPSLNLGLKNRYLDPEVIISAMRKDKKRTGRNLAVILLADSYTLKKFDDVTAGEVIDSLAELTKRSDKVGL